MGNILVVDDERSIRNTVKAFLEKEGHRVEALEEAQAAISLVEGGCVDVVLADIILPRISGLELLRRIRGISPHIQVIMMAGEPTIETASESFRLGAVDYLRKPVHKNEILKAVENSLKVKKLCDEKQRLEAENQTYMSALEQLVEKRTQDLIESERTLRRRAEELTAMNRLARKVNESVTVEDAVQCALRELVAATTPDLAVFFLREGEELLPEGFSPEEVKCRWVPEQIHRVGECLCGRAVLENRALYSTDIRTDPRCTMEECRKAGFSSFAALPLRSGPDIIGVLGVGSVAQRNFQEHGPFFEALATEMSIGLKKNLLYKQVQQHATELQTSLTRIRESEAERVALQTHLQRSQKMEAIGVLASGIAHDFNNILAAVMGYSELALMDTPASSKARKTLRRVMSAGERATDLVRQILAFSRQREEERKPTEIAGTVKEVIRFMRASLPSTIEIRQRIDPDLDYVMADPTHIHQVVMNLCTNAHHAMKDKGGVLEVQLASWVLAPEQTAPAPGLKPGPYVRLTVKDTGHGMDEETMEKIFDPYFTTKEKGVGTGLGLAVVHGIVEKHGGAITVESEPGKGSVFHIYLPSLRTEEAVERPAREEIPRGDERILLVDDEQTLVDMGKQMLVRLGYHVETRISSMDALALFRKRPSRYHLVITDLTMPNMTGDKLAAELMRIRPDLPVILFTGYSEADLGKRAKGIGIRAVVMKPVVIAELAKAIRRALDGG